MKRITIITLLASLSACSYDIPKRNPNAEGAFSLPPGSTPSFAQVQAGVLETKCATCHGVAAGNRGGLNLESYETVVAAVAAITAEIQGGTMPPRTAPALSANERTLLLSWIQAGAPRDGLTSTPDPTEGPSPQPVPAPSTPELTFASVYERVLQPSCVGCHGSRGGVNLETYTAVIDHKHDLVEVLEKRTMPPRSRPPLTEEQRDHLLAWIQAGAPFN